MFSQCASPPERILEVEVVRLDDVLFQEKSIVLLKIDTEGADYLVLRGCEQLLQSRRIRDFRFEEYKPRMQQMGIELGESQQFLSSLGCTVTPELNPASDSVEWSAIAPC